MRQFAVFVVVLGLMAAVGSVNADVQCLVDPCAAPMADGRCQYGCKADYSTGCNFQCLQAPTPANHTGVCPLVVCSADTISSLCSGVECPTGTTCGADWCNQCSVRCNPATPTPAPTPAPTAACLVDPCKAPMADGTCQYGCKPDYSNGCNFQCLPAPTANNHTICPMLACTTDAITRGCAGVECPFGSTCSADWCFRCQSRCNPYCANGNSPKTCVTPKGACIFACKQGFSCQADPCNDCQTTCLRTCPNGNTPKQCPSMNGVCKSLCLRGKTCQADPCNDCKPACL